MIMMAGAQHEILKVYARREEKLQCQRQPILTGYGGILPQKILKFRVLEMPCPAFSAGHFLQINTQEYTGIHSSYKLFILHIMLQVRYSFYGKKRPETQIIRIIIYSYKSDKDVTPLDKEAILFYTRTCICIYPSHIRTVGF